MWTLFCPSLNRSLSFPLLFLLLNTVQGGDTGRFVFPFDVGRSLYAFPLL